MTRNKTKRSAAPEQYVRSAHVRENQAVVYDDYMGFAYQVTFLDDRWWLTTSGEPLKPLEEFLDLDDVGFRYLCESEGRVGALALAQMLGRALEQPETDIDEALRKRIKNLKRLGVTLDVEDEVLNLEVRVFANDANSRRQGRYSVWCYSMDGCDERLFDIDCFDKKADAEEWANVYFTFLRSIGIKLEVTNREK